MIQAILPGYAAGMKSTAIWLKVLALCSTVALGGGYVWWSQKKSAEKQAAKDLEVEVRGRAMLSGSKSAVLIEETRPDDGVLPPADPRTNADFIAPSSEADESRTVLPSSKSLVLPPAEDEKKPKPRTVLPGSKSIDPILSPDHKP